MPMIEQRLAGAVSAAASSAAPTLGLDPDGLPAPEIDRPRQKEHGDWATNLALVLAGKAGRPPREVAQAIARELEGNPLLTKVEVAGPGFINMFLGTGWLHETLAEILEL